MWPAAEAAEHIVEKLKENREGIILQKRILTAPCISKYNVKNGLFSVCRR